MIRIAREADVSDVEAIVRAAYVVYIARIGRPPEPMHDDYASLVEQQTVYVLEDDGISGVIVLIEEKDALLVDNVAVHPRAQHQGHGRALLEFAEAEAQRRNLRQLRLYTNERMTENIALYARLGYAETHRAEDRGFRRVYMVKSLR